MSIAFAKYQGLGNDFVVIDNRHRSEPVLGANGAVQLCDRHFGIGADGVIFALPGTDGTDCSMRIFNADGSEPEMCGNGIRCLARFLAESAESQVPSRYRIGTLAGVMAPQLRSDGQVTVDMGEPQLLAAEVPTTLCDANERAIAQPLAVDGEHWTVTAVGMGNPHCITFVEDADAIPLATLGPQFEHHAAFPQRTNVEFVRQLRSDRLQARVWERGAGQTLACGTGACAVVVAGALLGTSDHAATVELPGGGLHIDWSQHDGRAYMTGPAERVFVGTYGS
jgi:diaminopimelate epimerase